MNFRNIDYLAQGTPRQRFMYDCLQGNAILAKLDGFDPVVVSTICLDVDIESSDIDIVCFAEDIRCFESRLREQFGESPEFRTFERSHPYGAIGASFQVESFEIEIFGAMVPVNLQKAYRHLSILARLIAVGGSEFRESIRSLKRLGFKTEPAIAEKLRLPGDPYEELLKLERVSDEELRSLFFR